MPRACLCVRVCLCIRRRVCVSVCAATFTAWTSIKREMRGEMRQKKMGEVGEPREVGGGGRGERK